MEINSQGIKRIIGQNQPVFIIAEMSANHNQDYERALKIIDAAAEAGVDAIKLQTYTADTMTVKSDKDSFIVKTGNSWQGETLHNLYLKAYTPWAWQPKLKEYAEAKGLLLFSSPFDETAVDFLEKMDVGVYKVPSFEVVDIPLLKRLGQTKKPVIMARGMASLEELQEAVKALQESGCPEVAILHCLSAYPAKVEEMNLATITDLKKVFPDMEVGLSDHSLGNVAAITSVGLGATIIEKHFTLKRSAGGADSEFSLEPDELKELVEKVRQAKLAIGRPNYQPLGAEAQMIKYRRSLYAVKDIKKGEAFTKDNVRSIRPGDGLAPKYFEEILGKKALADIEINSPLSQFNK